MPYFYCGRTEGLFQCDYLGQIGTRFGYCRREVCDEHSVPEFEGGDKSVDTLCKEHAPFQVKESPVSA